MKPNPMRLSVLGMLCAAFLHGTPVAAATITFEGLPSNECGGIALPFVTGGFKFATASLNFNACINSGTPTSNGTRFAADGTQTLGLIATDSTKTLTLSKADGTDFSLASFDAADFFKIGDFAYPNNAKSIGLVGTLSAGGTVNYTAILDGINDGPGGVADFQTFLLPSTFTGLSQVAFTGVNPTGGGTGVYYFLDNITTDLAPTADPVPEPTSILLLGTGLIATVRRCRSGARNKQ